MTRKIKREYTKFDLTINSPANTARIKGRFLDPPSQCRFCKGKVLLVSNKEIYGVEYGWPLIYKCESCHARVGCHRGTDIPLGTLANSKTIEARKKTHALLDSLWRGKPAHVRTKVYRILAEKMARREFHVSWLDAEECDQVIRWINKGEVLI